MPLSALQIGEATCWFKLYASAFCEVRLKPSQDMRVAKSKVCRLEVMKLVLEAALLLQGTEPEAGLHHQLQHLLNVLVIGASKEDALALLRERGGLLMQAATLSMPEEGLLAGGAREVPMQWQQQQQEAGTSVLKQAENSMVMSACFNTLVRIAGQIGELSSNWYMSYMVLSGFSLSSFERVLG